MLGEKASNQNERSLFSLFTPEDQKTFIFVSSFFFLPKYVEKYEAKFWWSIIALSKSAAARFYP